MARFVRTVAFETTEAGPVLVPPAAKIMAVRLPALAACTLSIQGSMDGVVYAPVHGKNGSDDDPMEWVGTTGGFIIPTLLVTGLHSVKLVSTVDQAGSEVQVGFVQENTVVA